MQDLRFALRSFRGQPVFSLVAILTLTLGIGATAAVFSVLYQVLLRPLPFPEADRLVWVANAYLKAGGEPGAVAIPDYLDRRSGAAALEDAALFTPRISTFAASGAPEQVLALAVTPSFFTTLRRAPALGRAFSDEDVAGGVAARAVVLTDATWRSRFAADPSIVGRTVRVNGEAYTVAGVLPRDFYIPWRDTAMLLPFAFTAAQRSDAERGNEFCFMVGRLRPGATVSQLDAQMDAIAESLTTRVPERAEYMRTSGFTGRAEPLQNEQTQAVRTALYIVQAAVVLVLLIACANVANLLLMRAAGRQRELAIRTALGAGRGRILRQLLVEGLVLSAAGGLLGLLASIAGVRALIALAADQLPLSIRLTPDGPVLGLAVLTTTMTGVCFGIVPAMAILRQASGPLMKDDTTRGSGGRRTGRARRVLVIVEAAVALVLLVGAGLLVKSFDRLTRVNPGFSAERVLTAQIALQPTRYASADARRAFWTRLEQQARAIPGVTASGLVSITPLSGELDAGSFEVVGRPPRPGEQTPHANQDYVMGEYFRTMEIPVIDGRLFTGSDTAGAPRVVIIDALLAKRYFPDGRAIGRQLNFGSPRNYTIVGIVGTVNAQDLAKPIGEGRIYFAAAQLPPARMGLVVKAAGDPRLLVPQVRAAVRSLDPEQPVAQVRAMGEWIERSLQPRRTPAMLLAVFGAAALALCAIGIYGVLAFGVTQRLREFGIRQALGARDGTILGLVLREGLGTAAIGLFIGLGASLALARGLQSLLFGVATYDPVVLGGAAGILMAVAAAACYLPARRATRADPIAALRDV